MNEHTGCTDQENVLFYGNMLNPLWNRITYCGPSINWVFGHLVCPDLCYDWLQDKNNIPEFIQGFSQFVSKPFFWLKCSTETN